MILNVQEIAREIRSFPRRCGGDPERSIKNNGYYNVFPAGAGVILDKAERLVVAEGFPRRCGGDPHPTYLNYVG